MKPKKNPKSDLNKKSFLFFQIGLVIVLFISWRSIEMKTYAQNTAKIETIQLESFIDEIVPIKVEIEKEKPKTKPIKQVAATPKAKDTFSIIDDKKTVLDSLFDKKPTSPNANTNTASVLDSLKPVGPEEEIPEVILSLIQKSPVFPGCENLESNAGRKACLNEKIKAFIDKNFNRDLASEYNLSGSLRTQVLFTLDNKGNIINIEARGPHPRLEEEARRVIKMLPEITPGKQNGKAVNVLFSVPILFEIK